MTSATRTHGYLEGETHRGCLILDVLEDGTRRVRCSSCRLPFRVRTDRLNDRCSTPLVCRPCWKRAGTGETRKRLTSSFSPSKEEAKEQP